MADPITVTLSIDLDKHLAKHLGYDEEGDPVQSPATVEDVVLGMAADKIVSSVIRDSYDWRSNLARRVAEVRDKQIADAVRPDVEAALLAPVQKTSHYGDPLGEPTTMRDLVVGMVEEWLKSSDKDSYRNPKHLTKPQQIIAEQVDKVLHKEMKAAVDAAKAEVVAAVQAKGAELMAKAIQDMATGR